MLLDLKDNRFSWRNLIAHQLIILQVADFVGDPHGLHSTSTINSYYGSSGNPYAVINHNAQQNVCSSWTNSLYKNHISPLKAMNALSSENVQSMADFFTGDASIVKLETSNSNCRMESSSEFLDTAGSSRSSSPVENSLDSSGKGSNSKVDSKVCGVCGDKALGNNFNAITCESCKAFFRRNALKTKDFVCPFNDNCKVDPVTRRFCQKCRLKKCFDIGMKKEWIMTDEEKKIKKIKIEQNRMKRQSSDYACDTGSPAPKAACLVNPTTPAPSPGGGDQSSLSIAHQNSPPDPTLPHKISKQPMMPHEEVILPHNRQPLSSNQNNVQLQFTKDSLLSQQQQQSSTGGSHIPAYTGQEARMGSPTVNMSEIHRSENNISESKPHTYNSQVPSAHHPVSSVGSSSSSHQGNGAWAGTQKLESPDTSSSCQVQMPLLSSLIRPGCSESPPESDAFRESNGHLQHVATPTNRPFFNLEQCSVDDVDGKPTRYPPLESSSAAQISGCLSNSNSMHDSCGESSEEDSRSNNPRTLELMNGQGFSDDLPLPLNTMDSILSVAIQAEFNAFGILSNSSSSSHHHHHRTHQASPSHSRLLNKAEQNKLNELFLASQALTTPVDAEGAVKVSDPSLINVINLTDIAIRRLIKMSKKISAFKNMCQEDQVALLKGGCTEMMILRSVVSYDPDRDSWNIPHSNLGYNIQLGVLKEARGNLYEEHQRFVKSFKMEWRSDENIMMLLCAITLFTAQRPNVIHKDVVKFEQDSYYYLLKRYLESTLNGCEARSTYLQLIKKIAELHVLNSNHLRVFLEVNPREVEPLLIEIFDLK